MTYITYPHQFTLSRGFCLCGRKLHYKTEPNGYQARYTFYSVDDRCQPVTRLDCCPDCRRTLTGKLLADASAARESLRWAELMEKKAKSPAA